MLTWTEHTYGTNLHRIELEREGEREREREREGERENERKRERERVRYPPFVPFVFIRFYSSLSFIALIFCSTKDNLV